MIVAHSNYTEICGQITQLTLYQYWFINGLAPKMRQITILTNDNQLSQPIYCYTYASLGLKLNIVAYVLILSSGL